MTFQGFNLEDIDEVTIEILNTLEQLEPHPKLAVLALCRAIADIGTPEDLDIACRTIDEMAEIPRTYEDFEDGDSTDEFDLNEFNPGEDEYN